MNTYNTVAERVVIPDIPIHKWISVIILENRNIDVYVNGTIVSRYELKSVPNKITEMFMLIRWRI